MAETMNGNIDQLPELGTKAAAVAGIESMIHHAIGGNKICTPVQLRYWLDAYYQARKAEEDAQTFEEKSTLLVQGTVEDAVPYKVTEISEEQMREVVDLHDYLQGVIRKAAKAAGIEIEETDCHGAAAPRNDSTEEGDGAAVSAPPEQADASDGQEDGGPSGTPAPTEADERKPKQRPVGWTDGFEAVEVKRSGAAEAAAYKREQFERLQRLRGEGVSTPEILKAAEGNISEDQLRGIMECRRVPVAVYRVLQAALDQVEKNGLPRGARRPRND